MSFVFRGSSSRGDIENGFHSFVPERRVVSFSLADFLRSEEQMVAQRFHGAGRPINTNPMLVLITMLLLFMVLNSHQVSPNFLLWFGMAVFLMGTSLRMYAMCQQIQAHANAVAAAATVGGLFGHTELRLRMPPIAFATNARGLQGLRLQLALLDREFDDLDYDALRALDHDNPPGVPALSDAEINALPLFKYRAPSSSSEQQQTSAAAAGVKKTPNSGEGSSGSEKEEELTCSVCLEQVTDGETIRSLPCLHQFHPSCIDQWLRQQATCPVCKHKLSASWQDGSGQAAA